MKNKTYSPKSPPAFKPGERVYLQHAKPEENIDGVITGREYGIVIDSFWDEVLGTWRCWIAFWGRRGYPKNSKNVKPYVLNYAEMFLKRPAAKAHGRRYKGLMEHMQSKFGS